MLKLLKRAINKKILGPIKYKQKEDYNAKRYWEDRFKKYGLSFRGAGHDGMSEQENKQHYEENKKIFLDLCKKENLDFKRIKVLEIGPGNGYYTELIKDLGVRDYTAIDITDVLFPKLKAKFPNYRFIKKDITKEKIEGKYDLIIMIEVILHIVNKRKFSSAMENVKKALDKNSKFILAPVTQNPRRTFFYIRWWSLEDIKKQFPNHSFSRLIPYRKDFITIIKNSQQ